MPPRRLVVAPDAPIPLYDSGCGRALERFTRLDFDTPRRIAGGSTSHA